ncbi:molybdenum cofactor guanylyltransferase, partial [Algoriphagus sp.]
MTEDQSIAVFILAGGKSSRMGEEKGLAKLHGKPMIQYLIEATSGLAQSQSIIGHHPDYSQFGIPVFTDLIPDNGPLGGIYTALSYCSTDRALILSCDSPLIQSQTLVKMIAHFNGKILVGTLGDRMYPFPGIYSKSLLPQLKENLEANFLKVQSFIHNNPHKLISWDQISANSELEFANINTPEELLAWEKDEELKGL